MLHRGHKWRGANAVMHWDEVAYSAYLASLIRGNPRRYDPVSGRGRESNAPESLFSIQFVPAYSVALPARWLRLSASTVFIILAPIAAFTSSLALFWFLWSLTRDEPFSATSVLVILGLGTTVAGEGMARHLLNLQYLVPSWISQFVGPNSLYHLPFLRLYQPAVAFPLFFVVCSLLWISLTRAKQAPAVGWAIAAGLIAALLVFSYFYLWTALVAWSVCTGTLWLFLRRDESKRAMLVFLIVLVSIGAALIPYAVMLSHRATTVDTAQAIVFTHRPDLFRFPEVVALLALILIGLGKRCSISEWQRPASLVATTFAVTVFVVFNQQLVTGRSLQPFHYQWYIANYCALTSLVLTAATLRRSKARLRLTNGKLVAVAISASLWAFGEVWLQATLLLEYDSLIDEGRAVAARLAELSNSEHIASSAPVVLAGDFLLADRLPTDAPQSILWAPRMLVFPGVSEAENRERFWQQLYYLGYDEKEFRLQLNQLDWNFLTGMFPYSRLIPVINGNPTPITWDEVQAQPAHYLEYTRGFNRDRASSPPLSYVVVRADAKPDYTNLDRWYERDSGERVGPFILYQVKLR